MDLTETFHQIAFYGFQILKLIAILMIVAGAAVSVISKNETAKLSGKALITGGFLILSIAMVFASKHIGVNILGVVVFIATMLYCTYHTLSYKGSDTDGENQPALKDEGDKEEIPDKNNEPETNAVQQAGKNDKIRKEIMLSTQLHKTLREVAFRENKKIRTLVNESVRRRIRQAERKNKEQGRYTTWCRYIKAINPDDAINTTVYITQEMNRQLKALSHYSHIPEKVLISDAVAEYLLKQYGEKYPDVVNRETLQQEQTVRKTTGSKTTKTDKL